MTTARAHSRARSGATLLCGALALASVACTTPSASDASVDKACDSLIGVRARELSDCLGPPAESETEGDTEILTFIVIEKDVDSLPSRQPKSRPDLPEPKSRRVNPQTGRPQLGTGYCELRFEVREGRVRKVDVKGRRADGLSDRSCILSHSVCFARLDVK